MAETKKKKGNGLLIVVLLIIITGVIIYFYKQKNQPNALAPSIATNVSSTPVTTTYVDENTILKKGMKNNEVGKLQSLINKVNTSVGLPLLVVDNSFGSKTEDALHKLTGKKEISYAQAEKMAYDKFKTQGYSDSNITSIFHGLTFGLFS